MIALPLPTLLTRLSKVAVASILVFSAAVAPASLAAGAERPPTAYDVAAATASAAALATDVGSQQVGAAPLRSHRASAKSEGDMLLRQDDGGQALTSRADCYGDAYADTLDGTALDVADYGLLYECEYFYEWAFLMRTADMWSTSQLDVSGLFLDGDGTPNTGCGGFEFAIAVGETGSGLVGGLYYQPTCTEGSETFLASLEVIRTNSQNLAVFFDNRSLGNPTQLIWSGLLAADTDLDADSLPDNGYHVSSGFERDQTACPTSSSGYTVASDDPGTADALRSAGVTGIRTVGEATVFDGNAVAALTALRRAGVDARLEPNDVLTPFARPNDVQPGQWNLAPVAAEQGWELSRGSSSVPVAVIDSGIDATHPDFAGKVLPGYNSAQNTALAAGNSDDFSGHGTGVAGVIAAATDNGTGIAGVGWNTPVVPIRSTDADGFSTAASVAAGVRWAADQGVRIINLSLGSCFPNETLADAVRYAQSRGALIIASVGNEAQEGNQVNYPAAFEGVMGVGATGFNGSRALYSNTGGHVDLVAPGGSLGDDNDLSHGMLVLAPAGQMDRVDGTSFSSPMVAAAAALVLSAKPTLTASELASALTTTATDLGTAGRDDEYGTGMLHIERALKSVVAAATPTATPSASPTPSASASPTAAPTTAPPSPSAPAVSGALMTSVEAVRVLDTRSGVGAAAGLRGHGQTIHLDLPVPAEATAAVLTVTVTQARGAGHITAYAAGTERPIASNLNFGTGQTLANTLIANVNGGAVSLFVNAGPVHVIADLTGYFSSSGTPLTLLPAERLVDSRTGQGAGPGRLSGSFDITLPSYADGADLAMLTVTATSATRSGHVTVHPAGEPLPPTSNLNFVSGSTRANTVITAVGSGGQITIHVNGGPSAIIIDLVGIGRNNSGSAYTAVTPTRFLDSRSGLGAGRAELVQPGQPVTVALPADMPTDAKGAIITLTSAASAGNGHLVAYAANTTLPASSNLNYAKGQAIANTVLVPIANGRIKIAAGGAATHVIADVTGYLR
jgi:subtilisin family serine protease/antitoxin (DNA-binding transcriptional repressor) of toxin-antitoxin stability system